MNVLHPADAPRVNPRSCGGRLAFITGCGRSGTTILGRLLSKHRDVSYLNDQFMLWASVFPEHEICGWLPFGPGSTPSVVLGPELVDDAARRRFRAALEARRDGRAVIVEKLAVNNFRMGFVRALAPESLLINIVRHGVDVAASIARRARLGRWWGPYDRKWACLCDHARGHGYAELIPLCTSEFHRGLLEWRMSVDAADEYFDRERPERVLRLRYEQLVAEPLAACEHLERFLGIIPRPVMRDFASGRITRQTSGLSEWPPDTQKIAGPALRRLGYPDKP